MDIKLATQEDIPWILDRAKEFVTHAGYKEDFYNREHAEFLLRHLMETGFVMLAVEGESRCGMLIASVQPHPYNPKKRVLSELLWWIPEEYRKSRAALLLLNKYTEIGKRIADITTISLLPHSDLLEKSLTKRGYKVREVAYALEK